MIDTLNKLPSGLQHGLMRSYSSLFQEKGRREANLAIEKVRHLTDESVISLTENDDAIKQSAKLKAQSCGRIAAQLTAPLARLHAFGHMNGFKEPDALSDKGAIARYQCEYWWRRQLRKGHGRGVEKVAIQANLVNKRRGIYASDTTVTRPEATTT